MVGDSRRRLWPWLVWLACFYSAWLTIVVSQDLWPEALAHWPIAVAMTAGSYVAGSTPMGGGTVGFPILVLLFDQPASLGRSFSFAVQSIGMTSASIFILSQCQPLAWRMLGWSLAGTLVGTPLGLIFLAPLASETFVKVLFAVIWASFGVMTLVKVREFSTYEGIEPTSRAFDRNAGLFIGIVGGACVAALTGVGIDMLIYTVLVLVCRADLKIAIPTSVVLMAVTSLVGIATTNILASWNSATYPLSREVFYNWLAAAPIVALGAPLGAFIVSLISRMPTLFFVAILCIGQFVWTCVDTRLSGWPLALAILSVFAANFCFDRLYRWGRRNAMNRGAESAA